MSNLDELLDNEHSRLNGETLRHLDGSSTRRKRVVAARTELAALRRRVEDAEMIARGIVSGDIYRGEITPWWYEDFKLEAGDDGLPILTPESRAALRGAK